MCTNYARTLPRLQPCVHDIIDIVHVQCNSNMHFIWIAGIMEYRPVAHLLVAWISQGALQDCVEACIARASAMIQLGRLDGVNNAQSALPVCV